MFNALLMPVLVWQFFHNTLLFFIMHLIGYMRKRWEESHNTNGIFCSQHYVLHEATLVTINRKQPVKGQI